MTRMHTFPVAIDPEWLKITTLASLILFALGLSIVAGGVIVRFISKVGSIKKAAKISYRTQKAAKPATKEIALKQLLSSVRGSVAGAPIVVGVVSFSKGDKRTMGSSSYGEFALLLFLGASAAVLTVDGVIRLFAGEVIEALGQLVFVCWSMTLLNMFLRDRQCQRRRFT